jgi:mRNA interferase MazF
VLAKNTDDPYCPDSYDIIWLNFDPQAGNEQAGHRMAYVLSPRSYNKAARLCLVCPLTTQVKGYPFEVAIPDGFKARGVVLADHVKSLSWSARHSQYVESCPAIAEEIMGKIEALFPA